MKRTVLLLIIGILCGAVAAWWLMRPPLDDPGKNRNGGNNTADNLTPALLDRAIEVVAVAENGKNYRAAIEGWTELLSSRPNDRQLLLNQAVTVLKWIFDTNGALASGNIRDPEKIAQLQQQLEQANQEADRVLDKLLKLPSSGGLDSTRVLLESELLVTRSRAVSEEEGVQLRKSAAEKLVAALKEKPDELYLAARLLKLADELQLDWPEVTGLATEAAYRAWRAHPRNLLLLVRCGQGLLEAKDKRLLEIVEASLEVAKPLMSMVNESNLKIAQLDTLVESTRQVVESGDWSKPPRVRPWFNILNSTTAFVADNRLLTPDVMALLDTSFLESWREQLASQSTAKLPALRAVEVTATPLPDAMVLRETEAKPLLAWYDYDVDRDFDLLAVSENRLSITRRDARNPGVIELDLPFGPTGFLIADFWSVDNTQRPQPRGTAVSPTASGESTSGSAQTSTPAGPQAATKVDSNSHNTLQEVLFWNTERVAVVSAEPDGSKLNVVDEVVGISGIAGIQHVTAAELDGDGDLDLVVATTTGLRVLQNNGNRTFTDISQFSSLPEKTWVPTGLIAVDVDRDLDLDIVCTSREAPYLGLLENILHNQLRFRPLNESHWQTRAELAGLAVLELDGNVSWDLALLSDKAVDVVLTRTVGPGQLTPSVRQTSPLTGTVAARESIDLGDLNLDGHVDVCLAGPRGVRVFWNDGQRLSETAQTIFDQPRLAWMSKMLMVMDNSSY